MIQVRFKKILKQVLSFFAAYLSGALLWILGKTYKIEARGLLTNKDFWNEEGARIFVFWHNRQLMMPFAQQKFAGKKRPVITLISQHRDGRLIARAAKMLGQSSVAGSSTHGAVEAMREMEKLLRAGKHIAITPDGPRGPLYEFKAGAIKLAQISGAAIYVVSCSANYKWVFNSWDKMMLAKPFAKILVATGAPIRVKRELTEFEFEEIRKKVEIELKNLSEKLDKE